MVLHCSKKLAAKLPEVSPEPLQETSPLGSWHGHLLTLDRRQCVMFCHDTSRYVLFLPGLRKPQFQVLGDKWFRQLFLASLADMGRPDREIRKVGLALGPVRFDTATDRSVLSSMRVVKQDLEAMLYRVHNVMDLDPLAVSFRLNQRPAKVYRELVWPDRAMRERLEAL